MDVLIRLFLLQMLGTAALISTFILASAALQVESLDVDTVTVVEPGF